MKKRRVRASKPVESTVFVHIGLPKTGTTAIQSYLYENRHALAETGLYYPETHLENFRIDEQSAHHLLAHKWNGWLDKKKFTTTPDEAWDMLAAEIAARPGRYIISSERFADLLPLGSGKDLMKFIRDKLAPAQIKIIGYVRRQDKLAESFLKQIVKVEIFKGTKQSYLATPPAFLDFMATFSNAAEVIGWENIIVRLYERKYLKNGDAVSDFLEALSIDRAVEPAKDAFSTNASISTLATFMNMKLKEQGLGDSANVIRVLTAYFNRSEFDVFDKHSLFSTAEQAAFMDRYREGTQALADRLGLPSETVKVLIPTAADLLPALDEVPNLFSAAQLCDVSKIVRNATRAGVLASVPSPPTPAV